MEIGSEFWDAPLTEKQNNLCSGNAYNTLSGRTALEVIARDLKAERGAKSVYMPAYCCDSMIAPFEKNGYEVNLTRLIAESVGVPVIASGGGGTPEHLAKVLSDGKADAALIASMVHSMGYTVGGIKTDLGRMGVPVRL